MKKVFIFFAALLSTALTANAKAVDEATAKSIAYNQYKKAGGDANDMQLVYQAVSDINGKKITAYYVFNTVSANGFVIVSGDDVIKPVLAYSTESLFTLNNMSPEVSYWLGGYQQQIINAIQKNVIATPAITDKWNTLLQNGTNHAA